MLEEVSLPAQRNALVSFQGKLSSLKENHQPFPGHCSVTFKNVLEVAVSC